MRGKKKRGGSIRRRWHHPDPSPPSHHAPLLHLHLSSSLPPSCPLYPFLSGFLSSWLLFACLGSLACMCCVCLCVSSSGLFSLYVRLCSPCSCCPPMFMCLCSWFLGCMSCVLCLISVVSIVCRMSVLWCLFYLCVCCVWCLCLWLVRVCVVFAVLLWLCLVVFCLLPVVCYLLRIVVVVVSLWSCVYCWLIGWLFCCVLESLL